MFPKRAALQKSNEHSSKLYYRLVVVCARAPARTRVRNQQIQFALSYTRRPLGSSSFLFYFALSLLAARLISIPRFHVHISIINYSFL